MRLSSFLKQPMLTTVWVGCGLLGGINGVWAQGPDVMGAVPYNPNVDQHWVIETVDLVELLALFGQRVEPVVLTAGEEGACEAQVAALEARLALMEARWEAMGAGLMNLVASAQSGPFVYDAEKGAWVATAPLEIQSTLYADKLRSRRLETGSARIGGMTAGSSSDAAE